MFQAFAGIKGFLSAGPFCVPLQVLKGSSEIKPIGRIDVDNFSLCFIIQQKLLLNGNKLE